MNKYLILISILISINAFGQSLADCEINNEPKLTQTESEFLNEYLTDSNTQNFDFTNKKVIFVTGNIGQQIITKSEYFEIIKERAQSDEKAPTWFIKLTEEEQILTGYDVIVAYRVKILKENQKRKILSSIKASR